MPCLTLKAMSCTTRAGANLKPATVSRRLFITASGNRNFGRMKRIYT